tara:strand:- start:259 stop:912 length:654 start_codon:yes stop_codon:yes gene_type:complete
MKLTEQTLKKLILEAMEPLDPKMKANLLQLLNGEAEDQRQGLDLADMLVPELVDQVDEMPQVQKFMEPPNADRFLDIIRSRIQEEVAEFGWWKRPGDTDPVHTAEELVADDSPMWTLAELDSWSSHYHKRSIMKILNDIDYEGDGHDLWLSSVAIDVVVKEFEFYGYEDIAFELELKWAFDISAELNRYFKNQDEALVFQKAKELSKLIRKTYNETE